MVGGALVVGIKLSRDQKRIPAFDFCGPGFRAPLVIPPGSEVAYKTGANSATATFHVGSGEVLAVRIPGEEGSVVLSCSHNSCLVRQLWAPLACLLDILPCLWLFGFWLPLCIASRTCRSPWSLYLVHLLPLWVLPISFHLGAWHLPCSWTQSAYAFGV